MSFCSKRGAFAAAVMMVGFLGTDAFAQCDLQRLMRPTSDEAFAATISVRGDLAIIGAPGANDVGDSSGAAYIYRWDGSTWGDRQRIVASDQQERASFGVSVAIAGDMAVVGAPSHDCEDGSYCGVAYIFRFDGVDWVQEARLTSTNESADDRFGRSVATDGTFIVIGASRESYTSGGTGAVYVFIWDGANWIVEEKFGPNNPAHGKYGESVSIDGDFFVVGAPDIDKVYTYYRLGGVTWSPAGNVMPSGGQSGAKFGRSVSVSGNAMIVGAPYYDCGSIPSCGTAYVFRYYGSWQQEAQILIPASPHRAKFGRAVAIQGDLATIGAPEYNSERGGVWWYRYNDTAWVLQGELTMWPYGASEASFGYAISVAGPVAMIGSPGDGLIPQAAYVVALDGADCTANGAMDLCEGLDDPYYFDPDGDPEMCPCAASTAPILDTSPPDLGSGTKNRFLSLIAGDPGVKQAVRVTFADLPPLYEYAEGRTMWVGPPFPVTEASGESGDAPEPTFLAATLQCQPYYTNWSQLGVVHVYDSGVLPGGTYEVHVVAGVCSIYDSASFSDTLGVNTSIFGDITGNGPHPQTGTWDPPQGIINFNDITAIIDKYKNEPQPPKVRADIISNDILSPVPDLLVDFVDITAAVEAYRGYPLSLPGPPTSDPCQ